MSLAVASRPENTHTAPTISAMPERTRDAVVAGVVGLIAPLYPVSAPKRTASLAGLGFAARATRGWRAARAPV